MQTVDWIYCFFLFSLTPLSIFIISIYLFLVVVVVSFTFPKCTSIAVLYSMISQWFHIFMCYVVSSVVHIHLFSIAPPNTIVRCVYHYWFFARLPLQTIWIDQDCSQFLVNSTLTYWLNVISRFISFLFFSKYFWRKKNAQIHAFECDHFGKVNRKHICTIFLCDGTKILEFKRNEERKIYEIALNYPLY